MTQIKTKIHEALDPNGKKVYIEQTYVLPRKIQREKARQKLKAMGVQHPNKKRWNAYTGEFDPSPLAEYWHEYGVEV